MSGIVWLASYPKSGNTWFRAFLANLLHENEEPADINRLGGGPMFSMRAVFDEFAGLPSSDLLPEEIDRLRPGVFRRIADQAEETLFVKAHDAYTRLRDGTPLFPPEAGPRAIYLIRNPLDVAASYAHHSTCGVDRILREMGDPGDALSFNPTNLPSQLPQQLRGWSGHVASWLGAREIEVHFLRYEDMKAKPLESFRAAIRFAGLEHSDAEIEAALAACAFDKLRAQEARSGFQERSAGATAFFRKGRSGGWREELSAAQSRRVVREHGELMRRFGYLDEEGGVAPAAEGDPAVTSPAPHSPLAAGERRAPVRYRLYGLTFALPFEVDALAALEGGDNGAAEVEVSLGRVDPEEEGEEWHHRALAYRARPGLCIFDLPGVARYRVAQGRAIRIEAHPGADPDALRSFLLNPVLGALLLQRGVTPFRGSGVVRDGRAYALLGHSSVGKSFLAAGLRQRGFQVASDHLCVVERRHEQLALLPGPPFLQLWQQGLKQLGEKHDELYPVRKGLRKFIYPLGDAHHPEPAPLAGVIILSNHNQEEPRVETLRGFGKAFRLMDHTHQQPLVKASGMLRRRHETATAIAGEVPLLHYHYLADRESAERSIDPLAEAIAALAE